MTPRCGRVYTESRRDAIIVVGVVVVVVAVVVDITEVRAYMNKPIWN